MSNPAVAKQSVRTDKIRLKENPKYIFSTPLRGTTQLETGPVPSSSDWTWTYVQISSAFCVPAPRISCSNCLKYVEKRKMSRKDKAVPAPGMKAYRESIDIALLINLGTTSRWVVSITPQPLYPKEIRCKTHRRLCWPHGRSGLFAEVKKLLPLTGFEKRTI